MAQARARDTRIRCSVAWLLGYYPLAPVEATLMALVADDHSDVRARAVKGLVRAAGIARAATRLRGAPEDVVLHLLEHLELERDDAKAAALLDEFARHPRPAVRREAARVAAARAE